LLQSEQDAEILLREFAADWAQRKHFFLGAWTRAEGAFAAQVYIGVVSWDLSGFEVGYFADVDHEGQGYVSEAVRGALDFIFSYLQAQRIRLRCSDVNPRSARVAERCGFVREGHLRQCHRMADGAVCGELIYGLLRAEYSPSSSPHP
jgi:RimJ/RimL family protein N-acetyltransferase